MKILLIEDDREAASYLIQALDEAGHVTHHAADGETGYAMASGMDYDVLIVDRMLPRRDGLSIVESLRAEGDKTPVLILSALGEVDDRVTGLRAGGDDYLTKPYAFTELLARVEVLARRSSPSEAATSYEVGGLSLDRLSRKVERDGETVLLQPREFRLLEYLMKNAGKVVTRTMLLENVWDYHFDPQTNVIDVHMSRLRSKIDKGYATPLLQTVRGAGYMIREVLHRLSLLWRTSTVRLTATFILIFVLFAILLLGFITWQSSVQIQRQQTDDIDREIRQLQRIESNQGIRALAFAVDRFSSRPGPGVYYLGDAAGQFLLGNVTQIPVEALRDPGVYSFDYEPANPLAEDTDDERPPRPGFAVVRSVQLDNGMVLVVGRDVVERRGYSAIIVQTFLVGVIGIILFSVVAGGITARRVLRRIDTIRDTSTKIMSGNLSERVPVTRRNDEFDGLATNLNAMLDRIEQLLQGLKEVTDNVAHDLKTPLTRLRNQAEAALRDGASDQSRQSALETTITESDRLIQTFNALLMIARAEAGAPSGALADVDVSAVVADVAELYGPVAEDEGITIETVITPDVHLHGNRELIGQAMVNLLENAVKYAKPLAGPAGRITVGLRQVGGRVIIEVADNGPGIPPEDRKRVLERFVRLDASRTETGSGLGLSLVDAVTRLHGGLFSIEDNAPGVRAVMDLPGA